jgi:hypothetical protein
VKLFVRKRKKKKKNNGAIQEINISMNTLSNKIVAYLTLLSGLAISAVAVYYSVSGLTAIFSAAVVPIIVMGVTLEISKLVATVWLKQNWSIAPAAVKGYLIAAIVVLMLITSMGIFGFLSKAHSDQSLVSGDVAARIAVYDEKIKIEKENIETDRKALKQMDDAVDQLMSRSADEQGADRSVRLRRTQTAERTRLLSEISESQKRITALNDERAPIAAESRKVEAEVGPIRYIAAFVYGNTDPSILERAVTWVILILILVFDPLAVILLLASQYSFQNFRKSNTDTPKEPIKEDPAALWNSMINAAEKSIDKTPESTSSYVQNEEQAVSGKWKNVSSVISEKDYLEATERNIKDLIGRVKNGILPFYRVPEDLKERVKEGLTSGRKNNTDNAS